MPHASRTMRTLSLMAVLLQGVDAARGNTPGAEPMQLARNKPVDFRPGFLPAQVVCDDLTIIRVEDAGDHFRLTGLKAGTTLCGFSSVAPSGRRRVLEIAVRD
jgi:hypothetical protein